MYLCGTRYPSLSSTVWLVVLIIAAQSSCMLCHRTFSFHALPQHWQRTAVQFAYAQRSVYRRSLSRITPGRYQHSITCSSRQQVAQAVLDYIATPSVSVLLGSNCSSCKCDALLPALSAMIRRFQADAAVQNVLLLLLRHGVRSLAP